MSILDVTITCFGIISNIVMIFAVWFVIVGTTIGILQTVFSVQDQSLPIVAKLVTLIYLISREGNNIYEQFNFLLKSM